MFRLADLLRQQHQVVQERVESNQIDDPIALPLHPVVSSLADLGEFKAKCGFHLAPSMN